jgi:hypothetical protein
LGARKWQCVGFTNNNWLNEQQGVRFMIVLDAITKSLQLTLGTSPGSQLPFTASYVDNLTTNNTTTPGQNDGLSNNTMAVTIVGNPAASTQRLIKNIQIQNPNTSGTVPVTIIYNYNSTLRNIIVVTLAAGDQLIYEDGSGWVCLDTNGNTKMS